MTRKMADAGADAALVVTPCFYKGSMTAEALEKHFIKVSISRQSVCEIMRMMKPFIRKVSFLKPVSLVCDS